MARKMLRLFARTGALLQILPCGYIVPVHGQWSQFLRRHLAGMPREIPVKPEPGKVAE